MEAKQHYSAMSSPMLRSVPILLAAMLAGSPACAQLYKWVDQRGVTNYSNQPPADPVAAGALRPIDNRVSVYSPDPALTRAVESFQRGGDRGLAANAPWGGVAHGQPQQLAVSMQQDPCLFGTAAGCSGNYVGYLPYDPGYGYVRPPFHRPRFIAQPQLTPGAIAGAVVGTNGYIPGYSAYAPPARALPAPRVLYEAPASRGYSHR